MLAFESVEDMQAHYRSVRSRIENTRPKFREQPIKAPQAASELAPLPSIKEIQESQPVALEIVPATPWDENGNRIKQQKSIKIVAIIAEEPIELPKIWLQELTDLVCEYTDIPLNMIWCPRRTQEIVKARFLIWALAREFCHQHSLPTIGRFCRRDHTTVLHGSREGKKLPAYPELARQVRGILDARAKEPES